MEESHNTHIITYSSLSDHSYKFDKDGNILLDNVEDLIYDKGINGDYVDRKKKSKEKFNLKFKIGNKQSDNNENEDINNLKKINEFKKNDNMNKLFESEKKKKKKKKKKNQKLK